MKIAVAAGTGLVGAMVVSAGTAPWTILRATQFHEFPVQLLARIKGPTSCGRSSQRGAHVAGWWSR